MDSETTAVVNENQTTVAAAMDKDANVEALPIPPPAEAPPVPAAPTRPELQPQVTPLMTPRPATPVSQTREHFQDFQSPPKSDIRMPTPPQPIETAELPQVNAPATPASVPRQPLFSPVREQTPMSEMREQLSVAHRSPDPPKAPTPPPMKSPRRSNRQRVAPQRLGYDNTQGHGYIASPSAWIFEENGIVLSPTIFKATATDPDTLTFDQAMADIENVTKWMEAAAKEILSLEKNGTWREVEISEARTWVFRRKRSPDGEITKCKARYCVRGDLEEGEPETYAPVVAWSSVWLFLVLSTTLGWETCSIDFSSAFVQAHLADPVWIHMP